MTFHRSWLAALAAAALALPAARTAAQSTAPAAPPAASSADVATPHYGTWGYDEAGRDAAVSPGTDFFVYANGGWYDRQAIPTDRSRYGLFDKLSELSQNRTRLLIEQAAAGASSDPDATKVGDAYKAFMDQARVEALDAQPLQPELAAIRAERSKEDVAAARGRAPLNLQDSLFGLGIGPDAKDPNTYAVYMDVAGLGLPDRDFYLQPAFAAKKAAYLAYVGQ